MELKSDPATTNLDDDCTGIITLENLQPGTRYYYEPVTDDGPGEGGSFRTLPDADSSRGEFNPDGLFNFSFEVACGNNQDANSSIGLPLASFQTLLNRKVHEEVDFAILNGDWLYELKRELPLTAWLAQVGIGSGQQPDITRIAPSITGLWENYKAYHENSPELRRWHRHVPTFYTIDDHEIINDVYGCATPGYQDRRPVFRDIAVRGWIDYLAWANPQEHPREAHFGQATLAKGSAILTDPKADFTPPSPG